MSASRWTGIAPTSWAARRPRRWQPIAAFPRAGAPRAKKSRIWAAPTGSRRGAVTSSGSPRAIPAPPGHRAASKPPPCPPPREGTESAHVDLAVRRFVFALAVVLLSACSTPPGGVRTSPTPTASVTAPGSPNPSRVLFAVLETKRAGAQESEYAGSHDTIAIAAIDGFAVARATFAPRHIPAIPMTGQGLYAVAAPAA